MAARKKPQAQPLVSVSRSPDPSASLIGRWRITEMELWDEDFVDAEVKAFIELEANGLGTFQFGYVHGSLSWEATTRGGQPAVAFTWEGNDEMDAASGRGWVVLKSAARIRGRIVLHAGDSSKFVAKKWPRG